MIYSQAKGHKLKHIGRSPRVALHFITDEKGDRHVMIFTGEAGVDNSVPAAHEVPGYLAKYTDGIRALGSTPEEFSRAYSAELRFVPQKCTDGSKIAPQPEEVDMKEKIRTLHPEKKQGVNISKEKYDVIRNAILCVLQSQKEITFMNLSRAVEKEVNGNFDGSVTWYVTTVKLDMEARGEIKRVPNSRPQLVKLAQ